jgi:hypothetical protein
MGGCDIDTGLHGEGHGGGSWQHASRLMWAGFFGLCAQWGLMMRLTWYEYSWDVMEPISYFLSFGTPHPLPPYTHTLTCILGYTLHGHVCVYVCEGGCWASSLSLSHARRHVGRVSMHVCMCVCGRGVSNPRSDCVRERQSGTGILGYMFYVITRKDYTFENLGGTTTTRRQRAEYRRRGLELDRCVERERERERERHVHMHPHTRTRGVCWCERGPHHRVT